MAIVETGQVTQAAESLGITQSAASQHVHNLEQAFGTSLLDRGARPLRLTLAGIALHKRAAAILADVEDLKAEVDRLGKRHLPMLRIGVLPSLATLLTPALIRMSRDAHDIPQVAVYADLASGHERLLKSRKADLVITSNAFYNMDGLIRYPIFEEWFLLVLPPEYNGSLSLAAVVSELPLLRFSSNTPVGRLVDLHLRRARIDIKQGVEADRTTMLMAAVEAGQGFAILTPSLVWDGLREGMNLSFSDLDIAPLSRQVTLVARESELETLPESFAQSITTVCQRAFSETFDKQVSDKIRFFQRPETLI